VESRRKWLKGVFREHGAQLDAMPANVLSDQVRVNAELDGLIGALAQQNADNPLPDGTIFPRPQRTGRETSPSILKSGHWSKPILDQIEGKALTSGSVVVPSLLPGIVPIPDRPVLLTQVIPYTTLEGTNLFSYLQESVRTHAAAEV